LVGFSSIYFQIKNTSNKFKKYLKSRLFSSQETEPEEAYNAWSLSYDTQPDNLMMALDETIFTELIEKISLQQNVVADVGCGTGRHWKKLYAKQPSRIIGYDVSEGMLEVLKEKFPEAETHQLRNNGLEGLTNSSCDVILSTLTLAHIKNIEAAFTEWNRVLKADGHIIITDYHPEMFLKGGDRTFVHNGKSVAIKNYVHQVDEIKLILSNLGFNTIDFIEKEIDETVKHYYEKQNALKVFERFKGTPLIYGIHLTRTNAIT
jgi:ubiquinone/menaquinone biosynthesis C-methylase UbiE